MSTELRCPTKLHGRVTDEGLIEIACRSNRCGWQRGVVVLHLFDPSTGNVKDTKRFRDPEVSGQEGLR